MLETLRDNPEDAAAQQQLKDTLQSLQQNADLIADNALGQQSSAALSALKEAEGKPIEAFVAAVAEIVGEKPIEPAAKPAPVSDEAVDQELLEVYLEEAVEVLSNIGSNANTIKTNPRDKEALTVIRRSFHTLKGSGRMVGLNHLGEVAWSVEQVMNKWLQAYAYRIDIGPFIFAAAGVFAVAIAFLTVGFHGLKAAMTNPVKSLRSE